MREILKLIPFLILVAAFLPSGANALEKSLQERKRVRIEGVVLNPLIPGLSNDILSNLPQIVKITADNRFGEVCELEELYSSLGERNNNTQSGATAKFKEVGTLMDFMGKIKDSKNSSNRELASIPKWALDKSGNGVDIVSIILNRYFSKNAIDTNIQKIWSDYKLKIKEISHGGLRYMMKDGIGKFIYRDSLNVMVTPQDCQHPCILNVKTVSGQGFLFEGQDSIKSSQQDFYVKEFLIKKRNKQE